VRPEPKRPNGALVAVASVMAACAVVVLVAAVFLLAGVVTWR
jgi:hypothetical protein